MEELGIEKEVKKEDKKGKRKKRKQDNRKKVRRNSWKTKCASRRGR